MLRTYPLDPHRRMRPSGILDLVRVHAEDLARTGRQPRTPATRTITGAGFLLATPAIDRPTP